MNGEYHSNCCDAYMSFYPECDICPKCGEHCEAVEWIDDSEVDDE